MPETRREWTIFVVGLCLFGIFVVLAVADWKRGTVEVRATVATNATTTAPPVTTAPAPPTTSAAPAVPHKRRTAQLVLAAARGDSWLVVRRGSASGRLLYQGTLAAGKTLRFAGPRFWLRVGAGANLQAAYNGRRAALPAGTFDAIVTRSGVAAAP